MIVKSLAFGGRGTYNPANREKGSGAFVFSGSPLIPRGPVRKSGIPKQDPKAKAVPNGMQLLLRF